MELWGEGLWLACSFSLVIVGITILFFSTLRYRILLFSILLVISALAFFLTLKPSPDEFKIVLHSFVNNESKEFEGISFNFVLAMVGLVLAIVPLWLINTISNAKQSFHEIEERIKKTLSDFEETKVLIQLDVLRSKNNVYFHRRLYEYSESGLTNECGAFSILLDFFDTSVNDIYYLEELLPMLKEQPVRKMMNTDALAYLRLLREYHKNGNSDIATLISDVLFVLRLE